MGDEMDDGIYEFAAGKVIEWEKWQKKFALTPKKVRNEKVWLEYYYERQGRNLYSTFTERGTLFDVIKGN